MRRRPSRDRGCAHLPSSTSKDEGMASSNGSEFELTMRKISACAEVDPLRKNGTQKTMLIVRSDFGIEDATQLLEQTTNASGVIVYGMAFNPMTPSRDKVWRAILFFSRSAN